MYSLKKSLYAVAAILGVITLSACNHLNSADVAVPVDRIEFSSPGLYPEGIEYDANQRVFLLSSLTQGTVSRVNDQGEIEAFIMDDELISSVGLYLDRAANRVIVANGDLGVSIRSSDQTQGKLAAVGIYDSITGEKINSVDLAALDPDRGHFANDVTVDYFGNIYVTDSFSPYIYKVNAEGEASIFATHPQFEAPEGGFGLNGIVFHPDGYLIVAHFANGQLFKVPVDDPMAIEAIMINETLAFLDGLELRDSETLIAVSNDVTLVDNQVLQLQSSDGWLNATVAQRIETGDQEATTVVVHQGSAYAIYSPLSILFGYTTSDSERSFDGFYINKVL